MTVFTVHGSFHFPVMCICRTLEFKKSLLRKQKSFVSGIVKRLRKFQFLDKKLSYKAENEYLSTHTDMNYVLSVHLRKGCMFYVDVNVCACPVIIVMFI